MSRQLRPADLAGADGLEPAVPEVADALAIARELDASLAASDVHPSATFADRVMAAIAVEPLPQPSIAAVLAVRRRRIGALVGALADTWRVAMTGGRPLAVRAQAAAFVLIAVVAFASLGGVAAAGALQILGPHSTARVELDSSTTPVPPATPAAVAAPTPRVPAAVSGPTDSAAPTDSPAPSEAAAPNDSAAPNHAPRETGAPVRTATPTEDGTRTPHPGRTPRPTDTPAPTDTPNPTDAPHESENPTR
jgi:hypothetical protein